MHMRPKYLATLGLLLIGCPGTTEVVGASTAASGETGSDTASGGDGDVVEDHRSFFIGESTKFDGGGLCTNAKLNTITSSLREALVDAGWTGLRFVDENTWPEDFREASFSSIALDEVHGDAMRLSIYAGHGNVGLLQWGRPSDNGQCQNIIKIDSRLGKLAGDTAAATMLLTSCTMRADSLWPVFKDQASRQFFGYHNSPYIGHDEPRKVFKRSQDGQPTADAWLEGMVLNILGKNSPVVFTMGTSPDDASDTHGITNLASGQGFIQNVGEPPTNFQFELYDSGCTKVCGNCSGNSASVPDISTAPVPFVKLTRQVRSTSDLVAHASTLLMPFDVGPLDVAGQARLEAWAASIVESGDVEYAKILDAPRIDLSYDPSSDLLRITDRDALARARSGPYGVVDGPADLHQTLELAAAAVRDELQSIPGMVDLLGTDFEVTTREVGYGGVDDPQPASIAFEYMFTLSGQIEGLALPDRHLGIGVTRLGELSTLTVSAVEVEIVGAVTMQRSPQQAMDALSAEVLQQYPSALGIEFVAPMVGYQLRDAEASNEVMPSLLVGYVLEFGPESDRVVSRRFPVRISLTDLDAPIESLASEDPNPQGGDDRAASN
jgi:hypothetical protein